jgi:hypothetical protein
MLAGLLLAGLAAAGVSADDLPDAARVPATPAAIIAGGKACVGTTVDPAGTEGRLSGWTPVAPDDRKSLHTDGNVRTRDHVLVAYEARSGCAVMASVAPAFDKAAFRADLGSAIGVTFPAADGDKPSKVDLPNGELMVIVFAPADDAKGTPPMVILALANQAQAAAKKGN